MNPRARLVCRRLGATHSPVLSGCCSDGHDKAFADYVCLLVCFLARGSSVFSLCSHLKVGIGADEFMGGYSRHRNAFNRGGTHTLCRVVCRPCC